MFYPGRLEFSCCREKNGAAIGPPRITGTPFRCRYGAVTVYSPLTKLSAELMSQYRITPAEGELNPVE